MEKEKAQFRFLGYKITQSSIEIAERVDIDKELKVNFEQASYTNEEDLKFCHKMITNISDKNGGLKIRVVANGYFEFDDDLTEEQKQSFFVTNAPALLFPYVRAYITFLTAQSGITPVILPTLNMTRNK